MTKSIVLEIESADGTAIMCVCEKRWRPIAGTFWSVREVETGDWRGFRSVEEIAALVVKNCEKGQEVEGG